jgi:hypothetical protein
MKIEIKQGKMNNKDKQKMQQCKKTEKEKHEEKATGSSGGGNK